MPENNITLIHGDGVNWIATQRGGPGDPPKVIVTDPPFVVAAEFGRVCQDRKFSRISIWGDEWLTNTRVNKRGVTNHPAEKDVEPYYKVIMQFDYPVIVDPFMGSGTIGVAALMAGRKFIGIEINKSWLDIAEKRLNTVQDILSGNNDLEIARLFSYKERMVKL